MKIGEMTLAIVAKYPNLEIECPPLEEGHRKFLVRLPNRWTVSCGYGTAHFCESMEYALEKPEDSETVEVELIRPNGFWHPVRFPGTHNGTWRNRNFDQVCGIIDYVVEKYP